MGLLAHQGGAVDIAGAPMMGTLQWTNVCYGGQTVSMRLPRPAWSTVPLWLHVLGEILHAIDLALLVPMPFRSVV